MTTLLIVLATMVLLIGAQPADAGSTTEYPASSVANKAWCGRLSSYTTWYSGKPILYVWKGKGRGNPYAVSVWYNNRSVPNSGNGVQTSSGPQVDLRNGWVGYFIAKRFYLTNWQWDDDWRWEVRGCLP